LVFEERKSLKGKKKKREREYIHASSLPVFHDSGTR